MSERSDLENSVAAAPSPSSASSSSVVTTVRVLFQSAAVILRHRLHFLAIYALIVLPLSLLLFSLAVSVHPIESRVRNLESLARLCHTRFEARQVLKESRAAALSALFLRVSYSIPTLVLSLASLVSSCIAASSTRRPTLSSAAAAVKDRWLRPLVTSICVYASMWAFLSVVATLRAILADSPLPRFAVFLTGSLIEVYLMAILGMGLVVSVLEERFGFAAIRLGSAIMEGSRLAGFMISAAFVLATGLLWMVLEASMDGQDWTSLIGFTRWIVGIGRRAWLIPLYGLLVMWSNVALTIFYLDCRPRSNNIGRGRVPESELAQLDTL